MFFISYLVISSSCGFVGTDSLLEAVYWEIKPFIFTNANGSIDGIIPRIFHKGQYHCARNISASNLLEFIQREPSRKSFYNLVRSKTPYGVRELSKIRKEKAFWGPVLTSDEHEEKVYEKNRGLMSFQLMKSNGIAVIVPRNLIALPIKIFRGIVSCNQIIIIALLLSVLFGIIIWMVERIHNTEFPKSFIKGAGTGVWWSLVSMTTVGYGDVVPRSLLGRIIALIWVFIGVMIACVMTATTTEIVTGVDDLSLYGEKVSVLENSVEANVALDNFRVKLVPAESYEEALELVRQGKVFAAMINLNVAAWYLDEIRNDSSYCPLRVVKKLPANINVNCLMPNAPSDEVKNVFKCMAMLRDEVYTPSIERFERYCYPETLYIDSIGDLFKNNLVVQVLLGTISVMIVVGLVYQCLIIRCAKSKRKSKFLHENNDVLITDDCVNEDTAFTITKMQV